MSMALVLLKRDKIIAGSDSRGAIEINGMLYAADDSCDKLHVVGDKLIFGCGRMVLIENIIQAFKELPSHEQTAENMREICEKLGTAHSQATQNPRTDERYVEMLICTMENVAVVYYIASAEKYKLQRIEGQNYIQQITVGTNDALDYYDKYVESNKNNAFASIISCYEYVFSSCVNERFGGHLTVYEITNSNGIRKVHTYPIKDPIGLRRVEFRQDPEKGIRISKNINPEGEPIFEARFFVTEEGDLVARQLKTDSDVNNYVILREQFIDFWNDGLKKIQLGFKDIGGGMFAPYMIWGAGSGDGTDQGFIVKIEDLFSVRYRTSLGEINSMDFINNNSTYPAGAIKFGGYGTVDCSNMQFVLRASSIRPPYALKGQMYFDTDLNMPIWYDGTDWVDAMGNVV